MCRSNGAFALTWARLWAWAWRTMIGMAGPTSSSPTTGTTISCFITPGQKFEEVALAAGVGLVEDGEFISGMGLDFRDFDNDGYPDIVTVALNNETFPLFPEPGSSCCRSTASPR